MREKKLFDPVKLGNLEMKNRLLRSATWENLADADGHMPEELFDVYSGLARGGVGAIITGFTSAAEDDRCFSGMARLSNDGLIPEHQRLTCLCHTEGCPVIAQIALGEYNSGIEPDHMTGADIRRVITLFSDAAERAAKAGYDGVQIHAAHGFFFSRFLSPMYNHRRDTYGGSPANRGRILIDILNGIRERAPSLHVSMKINCSDFIPGGLTPEESMEICLLTAKAGIDSIEVSGNGTSMPGIKAGANEAYFAAFALELAQKTDVPVILVGGHRSPDNMERVLNEGAIEFLSLSRPLIREPDLPNRWKNENRTPAACISCNLCYQTPGHKCIFHTRGSKSGY